MFADLDQIDIVLDDEDGKRVGIQTDHRSSAELADDEPRSLVFALARVLGPLRSEAGLGAIRYAFRFAPPARLRAALEAAGCGLEVGGRAVEAIGGPDPERVEALGGEALDMIGASALTSRGLPLTEGGLQALEAALETERAGFEAASVEQRHTLVLELGAAAGVILGNTRSGRWVQDDDFGHAIPFTLEADGQRCNVFGRAERFYAESADEGPSTLLRSLAENREYDGPILPVLRPAGFGDAQGVLGRPLVELDPMPERMPGIYLVQDRPRTVAYLAHASIEDFDVLLEASRAGLARSTAKLERVEGDLSFFVVRGSFYAATKVIDGQTLAGLAESLGADTLMVGLPAREVALVAPLVDDAELVAAFVRLVEESFEEQNPSHRLSDLVFVATPEDGVQGILRVEPNDEADDEAGPDDPEPWKF